MIANKVPIISQTIADIRKKSPDSPDGLIDFAKSDSLLDLIGFVGTESVWITHVLKINLGK
jgi:hypothetical protein